MRFGIKTAPQHTTWAAMLEVWREADDVDVFESAWNFDHFYPIFSDSTGPCLEAWTMLAAMAQATSRIRIGCQVTGMIYRHPAVVATQSSLIVVTKPPTRLMTPLAIMSRLAARSTGVRSRTGAMSHVAMPNKP